MTNDTPRIPDWVQPGVSFSAGHTVWHVRALLDGGATCRTWMWRKQQWRYEHLEPEWFEVWEKLIEQRPGREDVG